MITRVTSALKDTFLSGAASKHVESCILLTKIVAFSVDILSDGRPSLLQAAISASSVNMLRKSKPSVIAIGV